MSYFLQAMVLSCRPVEGPERDVMKNPVEGSKASFPGGLAVKDVDGAPLVFPEEAGLVADSENLLQTAYDHGPVQVLVIFLSKTLQNMAFLTQSQYLLASSSSQDMSAM